MNKSKMMFFESILKESANYELDTLKDTDSIDVCFYGDKSYYENWTVADIANNLRKGKILIEDDTGEMNTVIEDEIDLDEDPVSIAEVYMQSQNYEDFFQDRLQVWMDCNEED